MVGGFSGPDIRSASKGGGGCPLQERGERCGNSLLVTDN